MLYGYFFPYTPLFNLTSRLLARWHHTFPLTKSFTTSPLYWLGRSGKTIYPSTENILSNSINTGRTLLKLMIYYSHNGYKMYLHHKLRFLADSEKRECASNVPFTSYSFLSRNFGGLYLVPNNEYRYIFHAPASRIRCCRWFEFASRNSFPFCQILFSNRNNEPYLLRAQADRYNQSPPILHVL